MLPKKRKHCYYAPLFCMTLKVHQDVAFTGGSFRLHFLVLSQTNGGYDILVISQRIKCHAMPCQQEHAPPFQTENATDAQISFFVTGVLC